MIDAIKATWAIEMRNRKLQNVLFFRISQIYDNGVCVYFYYAIGPTPDRDQYEVYEELTDILRTTILAAGGTVSHHHGIGKKNMKWYPQAVSKLGIQVFKSIKQQLDPNNVFDAGNMFDSEQDIDVLESKM